MIIVTGANGFIGSALVWELNNRGYKNILCVDEVSLEERPQLLESLEFESFLHKDAFINSLDQLKDIQVIFHMGACSDTTETDENYLKQNNTEYTNRLFTYCADQNIPYIYASSAAVYGAGEWGFSEEVDPIKLKPLNLYGKSKLDSDIWIQNQAHTPPRWYGLRFFNVYGPNEYFKAHMRSMPLKAYEQILNEGSLKLFRSHRSDYNDGEQMRDFVYIKDVTKWVCDFYFKQTAESGIYNLGSGKARTWLDLARAVFSSMEQKENIDWIDMPESIRDQYQYFTEAEMKKLFAQGFSSPQWTLEKAIKDYFANYILREQSVLKPLADDWDTSSELSKSSSPMRDS